MDRCVRVGAKPSVRNESTDRSTDGVVVVVVVRSKVSLARTDSRPFVVDAEPSERSEPSGPSVARLSSRVCRRANRSVGPETHETFFCFQTRESSTVSSVRHFQTREMTDPSPKPPRGVLPGDDASQRDERPAGSGCRRETVEGAVSFRFVSSSCSSSARARGTDGRTECGVL